jgi:hypothetical protein
MAKAARSLRYKGPIDDRAADGAHSPPRDRKRAFEAQKPISRGANAAADEKRSSPRTSEPLSDMLSFESALAVFVCKEQPSQLPSIMKC